MVVLLSWVLCVCCQVEVSAMGRSLVQRSPTEHSVSDCDLEIKRSGGLGPLGLSTHAKKDQQIIVLNVFTIFTYIPCILIL